MSRRPRIPVEALRRRWAATPLGRFEPTPASALRLHALLAATGGMVLAVALQHTVGYRALAVPVPTDPLWPLFWAGGLAWSPVAIGLTVAFLLTSVAAVLGYRHRPVRVALAVVVTVFVAALSGFGKINHGLHHLVLLVAGLAFVPTLRPMTLEDQPGATVPWRAYDVVAAVQGLVLATYTLSGAAKVVGGVAQLRAGEPSLFNSASLSRLVAERMLQTGEDPPLARLVLDHPVAGAVLFAATVLIELLAVATLPFPRLAAVWAAALAAFHLAVFWSMHINFSTSIAVLVLLFGLSPFLATRSPGPWTEVAAGPDARGVTGSLRGSDQGTTTG